MILLKKRFLYIPFVILPGENDRSIISVYSGTQK